ncbi:unnamed protein product [Rotaria magnacalcarata]|uniref:Uncharacterized protein n=1 Tax=Rotaria magnacalcarata TaxID=392030 RepID=A0A819PDX9_9BILA|nr:unnamed protein product [Rotaria magnacalcarata]CAF2124748.1 unnamed protein product [Rotaria magnacalcarata]CAF3952207.1 unnamed protein product [Rotaria magnacalcarata]CAF4015445.1 unnamed protein product [Rotaria magnacalcarata]
MSLSTRSYSKESRSSSHYSRSSSYHTSGSNNCNFSYRSGVFNNDRPLSVRLIERDFSCPSLACNWDFDDPFFFDRIRWRFDNNILKLNFGLGRNIPISYSSWTSGPTRIIPIQYISSSKNHRHHLYKKLDNNDDFGLSFSKRHDENSMIRENRLSSDEWPSKAEPLTRKRTSMTIYVQQPYIDLSEVPYYRQTQPTPNYPQSARTDYY